jgi:hypothetical protein
MLEIGLPSIREVNRVVDVPVLAEIKLKVGRSGKCEQK